MSELSATQTCNIVKRPQEESRPPECPLAHLCFKAVLLAQRHPGDAACQQGRTNPDTGSSSISGSKVENMETRVNLPSGIPSWAHSPLHRKPSQKIKNKFKVEWKVNEEQNVNQCSLVLAGGREICFLVYPPL